MWNKIRREKKILCPKCNSEIEFGKKFCGKCGTKIDIKTSDKIDFVKNKFTKNNIGKKILIILILIVALVSIFIVGTKIYSRLSISVDELVSQERYSDAYKKSKTDEERNNVINAMIQKGKFEEAYNLSKDENIAMINELSYYCNEISEGLKNPTSFSLREVFYDKDNKQIVFYVNGTNSYGGIVGGYWYYTYNSTDEKYTLYTYVSDLDQENTYSWDSSSEKLEKTLKNLARIKIKSIISNDTNKIDTQIIDNINILFKNNTLKNVEFPNYILRDSNNETENV